MSKSTLKCYSKPPISKRFQIAISNERKLFVLRTILIFDFHILSDIVPISKPKFLVLTKWCLVGWLVPLPLGGKASFKAAWEWEPSAASASTAARTASRSTAASAATAATAAISGSRLVVVHELMPLLKTLRLILMLPVSITPNSMDINIGFRPVCSSIVKNRVLRCGNAHFSIL